MAARRGHCRHGAACLFQHVDDAPHGTYEALPHTRPPPTATSLTAPALQATHILPTLGNLPSDDIERAATIRGYMATFIGASWSCIAMAADIAAFLRMDGIAHLP